MTMEEILAGESKNVEFKVERPDKSIKYMKTVVAFANGKGGQIIFGVDDKTREVVGIPENEVFQEIDAITNAYVYLTGQGGMRSMIQCAVFKGTTRSVFLDRRNYEGPLWEQVNEAAKFVLRNIRMGCRLEGVYRHDIYELPPDSIRELIVNAVMNCSYIQASHIQVAIYDDRLEITSPGGLLPGVTIDLMKEGFSKIRNRSLANAFSYMNLVEAWGSGIPKLMRAMKEYGLREPEFIDMEVAFRINLYRGQNETNGVEKGTEVSPNADKMQGSADKVQDCADKAPDNANKPPTKCR